MSLQLWLPFNNSVENKGVLKTSASTASVSYGSDSRIGTKSLKSSTKVTYDVSAGNISTHSMSFSFWAKADNYTGTSTAWWQLCTFNCNDGTSFHIYCVPNARYKIEYKPELNAYCDTSQWHHLTYVLKETLLTIYLDGAILTSATVTNDKRNLKNISFGTNTVCINDFRLYNTPLSITEIERDYNSLLIHYPLRDKYIENTINLTPGGKFDGYGGLTIPISSVVYTGNKCILKTGSANSAQGSARATIALSKLTNATSYSLSYKWKRVSGTGSLKPGDWCDMSLTVLKNYFNGSYYEVEALLPARNEYNSTYRFLDFNEIGADSTYEIWDVQLERKDKPTPYTPSSRTDELIYDCSGRGYHSEHRGDLTIISDSARNSVATHFTPNNGIKIPSPYASGQNMTEFTIAFWLYLDSSNNYMYIFGTNYGNPTGTGAGWFSVNCESKQSWFYSDSNYWGTGTSAMPVRQWHHVAITFKNGTVQHYYDGQPFGAPVTRERSYIKSGSHFSLGDTYTGTSWSGTAFTGNISDFRFYGTALTASCIKDLYKNSGTVDNVGNIHVYELVED